MPKVSVVVPTYNSAEYLPETLQSILGQSYQDFEIIIVDDCSTDNTEEVVKQIDSEKIRYIRLNQNHGGPSRPRNQGVSAAEGQYIVLFDSDDLMLPGRISMAVDFLDAHSELGLVFTDCVKFDEKLGDFSTRRLHGYDRFAKLPKREVGKSQFFISQQAAFECLFFENYLIPSGATVPKIVFEKVGCFDETLTNGDDRDMWFRIFREFPIGYIDLVGFRYRVRHGAISNRGVELAENRIRVLEKQLLQDISSQARRASVALIAKNLYGIGYYYRAQGKNKQARGYYLASLKRRATWRALYGLVRTFLPT